MKWTFETEEDSESIEDIRNFLLGSNFVLTWLHSRRAEQMSILICFFLFVFLAPAMQKKQKKKQNLTVCEGVTAGEVKHMDVKL